MRFLINTILAVIFSLSLFANGITIHKKNAEVWSVDQIINGSVEGDFASSGVLFLNGNELNFTIADSEFSVPITLDEKENLILVEIDSVGTPVTSDSLFLTLGYDLLPELLVSAEVSGRNVLLISEVIDNPKNLELFYNWYADPNNPTDISVSSSGATASTSISEGAAHGEYYFRLKVTTNENDTVNFGTYVTVDSIGITPFDIKNDYAGWIDSAIVYEVTPYIFAKFEHFEQITKKLPQIRNMGINTLWLQPVMGTYGKGQGYDITNYFGLRTDLGTEAQLVELIATAKSLGMKVLLDFVANHSSYKHRYAQDALEHETDSHYYDFYKRQTDNTPYSQHYNFTSSGFMYYFWTDLWLYNFSNPEVSKWLIEGAKYWVTKYDIDGYRFDAVWGPNARNPHFAKDLRLALKRIKPEVLLLAEDKATWPSVFDERFDAAYDWFAEESWVSHWVWQTNFSNTGNPTIFNSSNQSNKAFQLRNSLTNFGNGYADDAKIFRFMENNDVFHFITHHSLSQTKMVAALMFSLNGIPMIYNGQEIGKTGHPYEHEFIFLPGPTIEEQDGYGLYPLYKRLAQIRTTTPALYSDNFEEISITPNSYTYAYRRWEGKQNVFGLINMGDQNQAVNLSVEVDKLNLDSTKTYYLTDMINGDSFETNQSELANITIPVSSYTTRILQLADTVLTVVGVDDTITEEIPNDFSVNQNFPNPFNPTTTISYKLPQDGLVKIKVFDALGREVTELVNQYISSGLHKVSFNANYLASGVYFYTVQFENNIITKKMLLIK